MTSVPGRATELYLGLDLGTSGLKAAALHEDGQVVAQAEAGYSMASPEPGFAQIDPAAWDRAVEQVVGQLGGLEFAAVGVAGQMHGVVLLDASGAAIRPAVLWPDRRAEPQLDRWRALSGEQRARLANPLAAGMAGPILAWLQEHDPAALQDAAVAVQPKDYVRTRLGGPPSASAAMPAPPCCGTCPPTTGPAMWWLRSGCPRTCCRRSWPVTRSSRPLPCPVHRRW